MKTATSSRLLKINESILPDCFPSCHCFENTPRTRNDQKKHPDLAFIPFLKNKLVEIRFALFSRFFIYDRTDFSSETLAKRLIFLRNGSGAAPTAPGSDDQQVQLWALAPIELTWLGHGLVTDLEVVGQDPLRALDKYFLMWVSEDQKIPSISGSCDLPRPTKTLNFSRILLHRQ